MVVCVSDGCGAIDLDLDVEDALLLDGEVPAAAAIVATPSLATVAIATDSMSIILYNIAACN